MYHREDSPPIEPPALEDSRLYYFARGILVESPPNSPPPLVKAYPAAAPITSAYVISDRSFSKRDEVFESTSNGLLFERRSSVSISFDIPFRVQKQDNIVTLIIIWDEIFAVDFSAEPHSGSSGQSGRSDPENRPQSDFWQIISIFGSNFEILEHDWLGNIWPAKLRFNNALRIDDPDSDVEPWAAIPRMFTGPLNWAYDMMWSLLLLYKTPHVYPGAPSNMLYPMGVRMQDYIEKCNLRGLGNWDGQAVAAEAFGRK
ncbi:hypothetical protein B0H11DRAFT_1931212 [Mycena galericulata]|nr:hypothetical protein B0H11DRAFT_1931212 [Mycena galericulata]